MTRACVGDIICWRRVFGYDVVPPAYAVCTRADVLSSSGLIVDRGGLDNRTAVTGEMVWVEPLDAGNRVAEIVPEDEVPDYIWAKIALTRMLGHGEKPAEGDER